MWRMKVICDEIVSESQRLNDLNMMHLHLSATFRHFFWKIIFQSMGRSMKMSQTSVLGKVWTIFSCLWVTCATFCCYHDAKTESMGKTFLLILLLSTFSFLLPKCPTSVVLLAHWYWYWNKCSIYKMYVIQYIFTTTKMINFKMMINVCIMWVSEMGEIVMWRVRDGDLYHHQEVVNKMLESFPDLFMKISCICEWERWFVWKW